MYDLLRGRNDGIRKDVVRFAQELVTTPSCSFEEGRVAEKLEKEMRRVGYDKVVRDDAGNVIGIMYGRGTDATVLLSGHMDTVSPDKNEGWAADPWSGDIHDGRLYGVGASDCKAGLAAQVYAGVLLKRALLPLRGNLVVAGTVGEENGRSVGLRTLLETTLPELSLKPIFSTLGEPTNLGLYYGHEGWFELDIRVEAIDCPRAERAADAIYKQLATQTAMYGDAKQQQYVAIYEPEIEEARDGHLATIRVAHRVATADDVDRVLSQVKHTAVLAAKSVESVAVNVAVREEQRELYNGTTTMIRHVTSAWETSPFDPLLARAREALMAGGCEVKPGKWQLGRLGMGTGGSLLVNDFQVPTIGYGPGCETVAHAANEYVEIAQIPIAVYGTALIAHGLVGVPVYGWTSDF